LVSAAPTYQDHLPKSVLELAEATLVYVQSHLHFSFETQHARARGGEKQGQFGLNQMCLKQATIAGSALVTRGYAVRVIQTSSLGRLVHTWKFEIAAPDHSRLAILRNLL
jgi:hypothetical protein